MVLLLGQEPIREVPNGILKILIEIDRPSAIEEGLSTLKRALIGYGLQVHALNKAVRGVKLAILNLQNVSSTALNTVISEELTFRIFIVLLVR